jgi:DNA-binding transcriptional ArsR family regulator
MIAAGGVIGVLAINETAAPPTGAPQGSTQFGNMDEAQARATIQGDLAAFTDWANAKVAAGDPTAEDRLTAAVGAQSVMDLAPARVNASSGSYYAAPPASGVLTQPQAVSLRDSALVIVGAWSTASAPSTTEMRYYDAAASSDAPVITTAAVFAYASAGAAGASPMEGDATTAATTNALDPALHPYLSTERGITDYATAGAPTDLVGLRATAGPSPEPAANWTASAQARIRQLVAAGALEQDALNLSLASQVLRTSDPATANALNAELRYRQDISGSFGDIRSTAEAARALALGTTADQNAARGAIGWLDSQGPLPASEAVWRLRAHASDGLLVYRPPPAASAPGMPALEMSMGLSGKGALAALLLVGGIGLSLSLVTVDALKGSRQRLYDTIRGNPGLHVNELRRRLRMSPSSVEYHLAVLTGAGLVVAEDDGRYKRFYSNGAGLGLNPGAPNSRNTLGALRRPHAVTLLRALLARPQGAAPREISRELGIHESAVSRRLNHLEDAGLLVSERSGRARVFRVRDPAAATKAMGAVEPAPPPLHLTELAPAPQNPESELTTVVSGPAHAQ